MASQNPSAADNAIEQLLKRYWGHSSFRPQQKEIIESVLRGHDTLALLPTGGGKSICYQLPALAQEGMCIVVSPLIALMKDQVERLKERGVKAACLVSGMNERDQGTVLNNSLYGNLKMLYVSPERLKQRVFIEHLRQMKVCLIAVDEAHCISQWGYDFRPAYREIAAIRAYHPAAPILALTATATPEVASDIERQLSFRPGSQRVQGSFRRDNLAFMALPEEDKTGRLLRIIQNVGGSSIVYVGSRRQAYEVAMTLRGHGIGAEYYHAGRSVKERDLCQKLWSEGRVRVMVATNAFGMGIDKSDVRFVVHLDPPASPEAYYQEAGRAGRDGRRAYCVVLYDKNDIERMRQGLDERYPDLKFIRNIYNGLCNYYKIPIGSGEGVNFPLEIEKICRSYNLRPLRLVAAMQMLEREGVIALPPEEDSVSRLHIGISREEVYRFQLRHPQYDGVLQMIFRLYGGLFTDYVPISEQELARRCYLPPDSIKKILLQLDALKIVVYEPKIEGASICFCCPRVASESLYLNEQEYEQLKSSATERCEQMIRYLHTGDKCRALQLLRYFGEDADTPCGMCDVCIAQRKADPIRLQKQIVALLQEKPAMAHDIIAAVGQGDESLTDAIEHALQALVDEGQADINKSFEYYCP